jgi:hypothetical protein
MNTRTLALVGSTVAVPLVWLAAFAAAFGAAKLLVG